MLAWSLDHVGPMARSVGDAAAMLQVIAGHDGGDPASASLPVPSYSRAPISLDGVRVGIPSDRYLETVSAPILAAFDKSPSCLSDFGAQRVPVELPSVDLHKEVHFIVLMAEMAAYHLRRFVDSRDRYGEPLRSAIEIGSKIAAHEYLTAQRVRGRIADQVSAALGKADVLALPTLAIDPPWIGQHDVHLAGRREEVVAALVRFTSTFNHTGHPAIAIPAGTTGSGLPASLQLVGRRFDEVRLLAIAAACEAATKAGTLGENA